jgi:hypothetical protein
MEQGPIFIGGPDRCGKTLLRTLLVSHPHIAIPAVGSNYWSYFYGQFGDLKESANFERCLTTMLRYKHARFLRPDADRIRREFWQGEPTYPRLFALFHEHYAEREGKRRWGDQTGLVERYADPILAAYPGARMIHMVRDPRDRYEASLALHPNGKMRVGGATARWLYSVRLAERNRRRYPDRYKIVCYETLVQRPEQTLREICDFLGEEFVPEMLTIGSAVDLRDKREPGANETGQQMAISTAYIGRFREVISKREIAFMQQYASQEMCAYDYDLDPIRFSPGDRLAFALVDWPINLARMIAWRTIEMIQHNFPAQFGRKPSAGMMK